MTWKVFTKSNPWDDGLIVAASETMPNGSRAFIKPPLTMESFDDRGRHGFIADEEVNLFPRSDGRAFMQAMLDAAWDMGLRPASYADYTNELKAVRYHLEDMRKLAKVAS